MIRQFPSGDDSTLRITERHIAFPIHPFDPPSSPPPTSPLPPLPEIATYGQHGSPVSTISPITPISTRGPPSCPPRPQTSLPNLQPRIIRSPEASEHQRHSSVLGRTRTSSNPPIRRRKTPRLDTESPEAFECDEAVPAPAYRHGLALKRSDDRLSALPKLFNKISTSQLIHSHPSRRCGQLDTFDSWQISLNKSVEAKNRAIQKRKKTKKPVARSALFIPSTPPRVASSDDVLLTVKDEKAPGLGRRCDSLLATTQGSVLQSIPERTSSLVARGNNSSPLLHRRNHAVTSCSFDFGNSQGSLGSSTSNEKLTSLPRIPSDPVLLVISTVGEKKVTKRPLPALLNTQQDTTEAVTFAALPYAHTLESAGPRPKTEKDNKVRFDANRDIEANEEAVRQLTEEQVRAARRRRVLWAVATITLVLMATTGVLIGIIWKLRALT